MPDPIIVIPARRGSSRYHNKPLIPIIGARGEAKPLIQRTWEVGIATGLRVIIATDDPDIAGVAHGFGAEVIQTDTPCANGTERCAVVAASHHFLPGQVLVNLQGDACLTPPEWLPEVASGINQYRRVATMVAEVHPEIGDVAAFTNVYGEAYHFARVRPGSIYQGAELKHYGVYAYTVAVLREYVAMGGPAPLEAAEDLEQNRWLHLGIPIRAVWAPTGSRLPVTEVNYPKDVPLVQKELSLWGTE